MMDYFIVVLKSRLTSCYVGYVESLANVSLNYTQRKQRLFTARITVEQETVSQEVHAQFCERLRVKLPWPTLLRYCPSEVRDQHWYLYLIMDIYSRKIAARKIHEAESGELAKKLVDRALLRARCWQNPPVLCSDNSAPMTSCTLKARLAELGMLMSHSRPRISNVNPYSESLFKTLKYHPQWPAKGFRSLIAVRECMLLFEQAYNEEHLHSGTNFVTPAQRHQGVDTELLAKREAVYE
jgi:putative transposase